MSSYSPSVTIGRDFNEIIEDCREYRNRKVEQTDNPPANWVAYISSVEDDPETAFVNSSSTLSQHPKGSVADKDIDFFLSNTREGAIDLEAYFTNYTGTLNHMNEVHDVMEGDYKLRVNLERKTTGDNLEEVLEEFEEGPVKAHLEIKDQGIKDSHTRVQYQDGEPQGVYPWPTPIGNKDTVNEIEQILEEHGLLK